MLVYIIDGFNLIHKIPEIKKSLYPHRDLITYIKKLSLTGSKNNKVIIVFDGYKNNNLDYEYPFEIIFSGLITADEVIKLKIAKASNKAILVIVTDDREIRDYADKYRVKTLYTEEFIKIKKPHLAKLNQKDSDKEISYVLQKEITDQMRKIWLKEE